MVSRTDKIKKDPFVGTDDRPETPRGPMLDELNERAFALMQTVDGKPVHAELAEEEASVQEELEKKAAEDAQKKAEEDAKRLEEEAKKAAEEQTSAIKTDEKKK